jgi:hypothetical protein
MPRHGSLTMSVEHSEEHFFHVLFTKGKLCSRKHAGHEMFHGGKTDGRFAALASNCILDESQPWTSHRDRSILYVALIRRELWQSGTLKR